jgi:hypothetical protein
VALPPSVAPSNAFKAILAGAMRMTWTALPITSAERFL